MEPVILRLPALHLFGLRARFIGPASPNGNNAEVIPQLYDRFAPLIRTLPAQADRYVYGAVRLLSEGTRRHPDELEYLAAINVRPGVQPKEPLELWMIPGGIYAQFSHRGTVSSMGETIRHAFGSWLPHSDYVHRGTPNLDRQDERFAAGGRECDLDFFIPVKPKRG